jgi:hypothetical protein
MPWSRCTRALRGSAGSALADLLEEIRVAERDHERDHQRHRAVRIRLDRDPLGREDAVELGGGERTRGDGRLELAVDHAVRPIADHRELVRERRAHACRVAAIGIQPDAERRQELVVRDVLNLGADHAPGDLELRLAGERRPGERRHDAVVLPGEEGVDRRQRDVLVRTHVSGDHGSGGRPGERAHEIHRRGGRRVAARGR